MGGWENQKVDSEKQSYRRSFRSRCSSAIQISNSGHLAEYPFFSILRIQNAVFAADQHQNRILEPALLRTRVFRGRLAPHVITFSKKFTWAVSAAIRRWGPEEAIVGVRKRGVQHRRSKPETAAQQPESCWGRICEFCDMNI